MIRHAENETNAARVILHHQTKLISVNEDRSIERVFTQTADCIQF